MYIPCDKTFPWVPKLFTLWPWPWNLTYFLKIFNLGNSFLTRRGRAFICAFLVVRPSMLCYVWCSDLDLEGWPTLKKMTRPMTFESGVTYCCYFYIWLPPASYVVFLTTLVIFNYIQISVEIRRIVMSLYTWIF